MKKHLLLFGLIFIFISCSKEQDSVRLPLDNQQRSVSNRSKNPEQKVRQKKAVKLSQETINNEPDSTQGVTIDIPENHTILGNILGDLDNDGINERVIVFDTGEADIFAKRKLIIYKNVENNWEEYYTSSNAVLSIGKSNMKVEPFHNISIKENVLVIQHLLKSRAELVFTHKYRYQNDDFYLIGLTNTELIQCDYKSMFDYNLSTGKIIYEDNTIECNESGNEIVSRDNNETFYHKLDALPTLKNIEIWENNIISPKLKVQLYY